jgi:hypothetical protein
MACQAGARPPCRVPPITEQDVIRVRRARPYKALHARSGALPPVRAPAAHLAGFSMNLPICPRVRSLAESICREFAAGPPAFLNSSVPNRVESAWRHGGDGARFHRATRRFNQSRELVAQVGSRHDPRKRLVGSDDEDEALLHDCRDECDQVVIRLNSPAGIVASLKAKAGVRSAAIAIDSQLTAPTKRRGPDTTASCE